MEERGTAGARGETGRQNNLGWAPVTRVDGWVGGWRAATLEGTSAGGAGAGAAVPVLVLVLVLVPGGGAGTSPGSVGAGPLSASVPFCLALHLEPTDSAGGVGALSRRAGSASRLRKKWTGRVLVLGPVEPTGFVGADGAS